MALCSSAQNSLNHFSKHIQDDRGLHKDRFSSRGRPEGQAFRSASFRQHEQASIVSRIDKASQANSLQAGFDFNQFSSSYSPPLDFAPPTQQLQPAYQKPKPREHAGTAAAGWLSEYQNRSLGSEKVVHNQSQQLNGPNAISPQETINRGHTHVAQRDLGTGYAHRTNGFMFSRPALGTVPQLHNLGNQGWKQSNLPATQSTVERSLEGPGWENIFASLETTTKTDVGLLEDLTCHQDMVATQEELVLENTEVDNLQILKTRMTDYQFQDENPFSKSINPFEEGMRIIETDGNLSVAALAFEAAAESNPAHFEAWRMLGSVLSEVEREETAIEALKEALKLEPKNLDVIMRLAISYTNEGASTLAYEHLETWITTKYPEITITNLESSDNLPTSLELLERIKEPFLQAARLSVTSGNDLDPDVQVGLGVLLFSAKEFQLAADCFSAAIQSTIPGSLNTDSQLHLLWNRYGACLGNMDHYNEAVDAYEMALAIRPNFVRARYNLGLLHYNQNEPLKAANTVLEALVAGKIADSKARAEMLKVVKIGTSHGRLEEIMHRGEPSTMYDTLRKCCGSLLKWDLMELVQPGMDLQRFQQELDRI